MVVLEEGFSKALLMFICWKKWRDAWLRWPTSTTLPARPSVCQQRAAKGRRPARLAPLVTWLPQSCTRSLWGDTRFICLHCCCSSGTVLEHLFVLQTARCFFLIRLNLAGSFDYRFTSWNVSFLCSLWEMNQQFGYTSVEYPESQWKILNQRADVLFYVKTETNSNNWL